MMLSKELFTESHKKQVVTNKKLCFFPSLTLKQYLSSIGIRFSMQNSKLFSTYITTSLKSILIRSICHLDELTLWSVV